MVPARPGDSTIGLGVRPAPGTHFPAWAQRPRILNTDSPCSGIEDGSIDPFSNGTYIAADDTTRHLDRDEFEIRIKDTWRSPHTGVTYPARWTIIVPAVDLRLEIEPHLVDQELAVSYAYWEDAVQVEGQRADQAIRGNGYVEMTGYASSMQGQF